MSAAPGPRPPVRSSRPGPAKIAVLLSGRGSNFVALAEACARGEVPAEIVLVLSDRPDAPGLDRARERGIPARAVPRRGLGQVEQERQMIAALREAGAEWVCLAGYMRIVGPELIAAFARRILNIHPALLPAFPGLDGQQQAWEYGVKVSGCTVHLVDEGCDTGPIVVQRVIPVLEADTPETLAARILEQEHRAYAESLRLLLTRPWRLLGRRVVFDDIGGSTARPLVTSQG
ncbi:MAG TPA: phosphoribosylglycinamide formyltransferase [Thermoanaerobaculaceae bacterium]|nr:phosphoribosylglycinamide formyltransferase [Thermoanaerobaculaceae bacterium]HPS77574.1 phosphoribosylglycinamide formyltransferase [Thermoanaerobaculaceae bacterium]